jgi:hypothetical protein
MKFIMSGHQFEISTLSPDIDQAFIDLHEAFFGQHPYNWETFSRLSLEFFDRVPDDSAAHNKYFENFTIIWRNQLEAGRASQAESIWEMATQPALQWELLHPGRFIHKGTPFYFWGMTAISRGNIDRGYLLMHQALAEDIRTTKQAVPNTPSLAFVSLNYSKVDQTSRNWLVLQAQFLDSLLPPYRAAHGKSLTLDDLAKRFLTTPPSTEALFLFAYTLARILRLADSPSFSLASDFAGQLELNLLFDAVLVLDAALLYKNPACHQFIDHAAFLSTAANASLTKDGLKEVNGMFNADFDTTLASALDGTLTLSKGPVLSPLDLAIVVSYGLRNRAAHNISSSPTLWKQFNAVRQSVFDSLFLCVETLY